MANAIAPPPALSVPGPRPWPWLGRTLNSVRFVQDSVGYSRHLFATYGNLVTLAQGGRTRLYSPRPTCPGTVFACGPDLLREVTTRHDIYYKYPLTGSLYRRQGKTQRTQPLQHFLVGLFGVNEDQHLQERKLMMPAFHRQRLATYAQDMVAITADEMGRLPCGEVIEMAAWMRQLTLRIATKTLFGEDMGTPGGGVGQLIQTALSLQGNLLLRLLPLDWPGLPWHRYLDIVAQYETEMRGVIEAKQARGGDEADVLSMLLQVQDEDTGGRLSATELLGHVGVLFVAGHETSANALTWTLFLLSQHPQIMADLWEELNAVLEGDRPSLGQIQQCVLLDRVVKESLRILPPVPWNGRVTAKPTTLGGYDLPAGTEVLASIYQTHHLPEIYPQPETFQPSRWETITPNNYEYNPFSAGPRMCIGAGFAMMEIKLILALLLPRYRFQFVPKYPIDRSGAIVMAPKWGLPMQVQPQDRQFHLGVGQVRGNIHEMVTL